MTTLLITEDFILADRRAIALGIVSNIHVSEPKLWVDPKGRGAIGAAGSRRITLTDIHFSRYFDAAFKASETMQPEDLAEFNKLNAEFFVCNYAAYLITAKGAFVLNERIDAVTHPFLKETGSGGIFAKAAWYYGVKPEDIIPLVATFDETTSPDFDLFYRKDIK